MIPVLTGIVIALVMFAMRQTVVRSSPERRHGLEPPATAARISPDRR